ncbi:hypothetical protein GQ53DRAFT_844034 [Thozetella sp. PMI_491]|nr:hypothetical protein GQ53DRAFT_849786 [Thozetella sp. PMI_491]KAH8887944.1 hypothetical protein GQ53DRAFT_844034 [Thozetella sp. PMI_491]
MDAAGQKVGNKDARLRSRGCLACIRMKVKRCARGRRPCPGYRDATAFVFRYESGSGNNQLAISNVQGPQIQGQTPSKPMPTDWKQVALLHFFENFMVPSTGGFPGYFEMLPRIYNDFRHLTYLNSIFEAISMASLARVKRMGDEHLRNAGRAYGNAMQHLVPILENKDEAASVAVLVTAELMRNYEIIMGLNEPGSLSAHRAGQLELLRLRSSRKPDGYAWVDRSVLAGARVTAIATPAGDDRAPEADDLTLPNPPAWEATPSLTLVSNLLPRVNVICARVLEAYNNPFSGPQLAKEFALLQQLNSDLISWKDTVPESWGYKVYPNITAGPERMFPPFLNTLIVVPNIHLFSTWISYWIARLDVARCIATVLPSVVGASVALHGLVEARTVLLENVDNLCAVTPYVLGHVDDDGRAQPDGTNKIILAFLLTRALYVVSMLPGLPDDRRDWVLDRLRYIGLYRGIGQALRPNPGKR